MARYTYRGATTKQLYVFLSPLIDSNGNAVVGGAYSTTTYSGPLNNNVSETVVIANRDGSMARGTAGPGVQVPSSQVGIGTNTLPTTVPSAWEQQ